MKEGFVFLHPGRALSTCWPAALSERIIPPGWWTTASDHRRLLVCLGAAWGLELRSPRPPALTTCRHVRHWYSSHTDSHVERWARAELMLRISQSPAATSQLIHCLPIEVDFSYDLLTFRICWALIVYLVFKEFGSGCFKCLNTTLLWSDSK